MSSRRMRTDGLSRVVGFLTAGQGTRRFIGSEIVKALLDRGYTAHGTVRVPDNAAKVEPLSAPSGADHRRTTQRWRVPRHHRYHLRLR